MARLNKRNREQQRLVDKLQNITALQVESKTTIQHSGPLPAPETLAGYNQVLPGLAERIVRTAEVEGEHRRTLESQLLAAQIEDGQTYRVIEKRGQLCAVCVAVLTIGGGFTVIGLGHPLAGSLLGGGTLISLVGLFIYGRERRIKELNQSAGSKSATRTGEIERREG